MLPLENVIANHHVWDLTLIVKDGLDLTVSPLNMCGFMRYICMPNIKSLSVLVKKVMTNVKVCNKQTHKWTGQKQYAPKIYSKHGLCKEDIGPDQYLSV